MSVMDTNAAAPAAAPPAAPPAPAAAPPAPPTAPATAPPSTNGQADVIDAELPDQPLFDVGYVRSVRSEAQRYREAARAAEAKVQAYGVFDAYDPADRQVWIDLARMWQTDPGQAAEVMARISSSVLDEGNPDGSKTAPEVPAPESGTGDQPLTPEAVEALIATKLGEQETKRAEAAAVEAVYQEVRNAGYDPDTKEGFMVLWLANNETEGNLAEAVNRMRAWEQGIVDKYVQGKAAPMPGVAPTQGAVATSAPTTASSWKETASAAQQFLQGQVGA